MRSIVGELSSRAVRVQRSSISSIFRETIACVLPSYSPPPSVAKREMVRSITSLFHSTNKAFLLRATKNPLGFDGPVRFGLPLTRFSNSEVAPGDPGLIVDRYRGHAALTTQTILSVVHDLCPPAVGILQPWAGMRATPHMGKELPALTNLGAQKAMSFRPWPSKPPYASPTCVPRSVLMGMTVVTRRRVAETLGGEPSILTSKGSRRELSFRPRPPKDQNESPLSLPNKVLMGAGAVALSAAVFTFGAVILLMGAVSAILLPTVIRAISRGGGLSRTREGAAGRVFGPQFGDGLFELMQRGLLRMLGSVQGLAQVPQVQREVQERVLQNLDLSRALGSRVQAVVVSASSQRSSIFGVTSSSMKARLRIMGDQGGGTAEVVAHEGKGGEMDIQSLIVQLDNGQTFNLSRPSFHRSRVETEPPKPQQEGGSRAKARARARARASSEPMDAEYRDKGQQ
ncbi:unnamed protein product [Discosporangium mesarthrocarpum]